MVMTDGQQTPHGGQTESLEALAAKLKQKGVIILSVGIGSGVLYSQLLTIAQGVNENVVIVDNFRVLKNRTETLIGRSCRGKNIIKQETFTNCQTGNFYCIFDNYSPTLK